MVRFLLASLTVLSLAALAAAACGPARTPVRSALGALREHRQERIHARGAGCSGVTVSGGCRGAVGGCTGTVVVVPAPMPVKPMPEPPKKK